MAYPVSDGAILEFTVKGVFEGQVCMTVLHYKLVESLGLPDGDAAIAALNLELNDLTDFIGFYAACVHSDYLFSQLVYQWIWPIRFHRQVKVPVPTSGVVTGTKLPPNVSAAISKFSDLASRHSRGSVHMPAVPGSFHSQGLITMSGQASYTDLAGHIVLKRQTDSLVPILFNRPNPAVSEVVTNARPETTSRVSRRRTVGLGI